MNMRASRQIAFSLRSSKDKSSCGGQLLNKSVYNWTSITRVLTKGLPVDDLTKD